MCFSAKHPPKNIMEKPSYLPKTGFSNRPLEKLFTILIKKYCYAVP
jgi:hypothetical protein